MMCLQPYEVKHGMIGMDDDNLRAEHLSIAIDDNEL